MIIGTYSWVIISLYSEWIIEWESTYNEDHKHWCLTNKTSAVTGKEILWIDEKIIIRAEKEAPTIRIVQSKWK
jgi:hypothetical protein